MIAKRNTRSDFYKEIFVLVLPIVIQNLIVSSVSFADVLMLGQVDQTSLAASSLAGQVQFLLNVMYFGLNSALTILAAQYWGRQDKKTIAKILGMGLIICMGISTAVTILSLVCPEGLMRIWTNDTELIRYGAKYLRFVSLSYFFAGISQPYLTIMKSCERIRLSTVISAVTLGINVILNAVLIFGLLGSPAMGITGAAIATSVSRGIELLFCGADYMKQDIIPRDIMNMFAIPRELVSDFIRYSLPAFINDAMWGLAFNMNSIIMGHLGEDIVAANSIVTVVRDLVSTAGFGIAAASSIMLGKEIGFNELDKAKEDAASILKLSFVVGIVQGAVLLIFTPVIPGLAKLSATAAGYLRVMLLINTVYQLGAVLNTVLISSLFRCGGDSRYGMILDIICMWCFAVPLGLISAFVLRLPPLIVYILMCTDEFAKLPFALHHYKSKSWIKNLTRDFTATTQR